MKRFEYLSIRVMALLAAALCIHLFLIAVLLFLAFMGHAPSGPPSCPWSFCWGCYGGLAP